MLFPLRLVFVCVLASLRLAHTPSAESDRDIANRMFAHAFENKLIERSPGEIAVVIGRRFIGSPYEAKTLETGSEERLIVNLRTFDCVTFVESIAALTMAVKSNRLSFDAFSRFLRKLRYRDGVILGYGSRLHYFTDWIHDNVRKGLMENRTGGMGGTSTSRRIEYMTTHRSMYPPLAQDTVFRLFRSLEDSLSARPAVVIPRDRIPAAIPAIMTGDIIAVTTDIDGLDVVHTGYAVREPDGSVHLLHSSERHGAVEITEEPLERYLQGHTRWTGIIVVRLLTPPEEPGP